MSKTAKSLSADDKENLLSALQSRFENNMHRHKNIKWDDVLKSLDKSPAKLWSLNQMELSGGEPDVVDLTGGKNEIVFCDCSKESPKERRSLCFDREAWESRKQHKPEGSAMEAAGEMGVEILDEEEYRRLQELEPFDLKTSSWIKTPDKIRKLGGALFCDRRYDTVFTYHNGAESYYASRAFRAKLTL